ncbi:hypothetical protein Zmor_023530 [Zophobas morio]|uniref:Transposable element P transposase-like GTP-binding insertion domain-containing protein n=1 Tax=Zophobas morio TaxID=2755281 RepID=A0AA38HXI0_9CUCU|nr:hypothetical protein Zmor_023530 [Zophobas morio]
MQYGMKICIAAEVMSHTVALFLYTLLSLVEREQRTLATATFVHQVDELFGTFNGRQLNTGYELQGVEQRNFARVNALVVLGKSISGRENMAVPKAYQNG